ncbi:hypothetical protein CK203_020060 [Vitis vinifera]|uniref:Uncharacterized protein n=1 Tax=Vitis vinifera TaxID=29760 RepID=A0A438J879_VITVI|nr:hypothetical protein CK203_020060 [Vitis vinifera]
MEPKVGCLMEEEKAERHGEDGGASVGKNPGDAERVADGRERKICCNRGGFNQSSSSVASLGPKENRRIELGGPTVEAGLVAEKEAQ